MEAKTSKEVMFRFARLMGNSDKIRKVWNDIRRRGIRNDTVLVSAESRSCQKRVAEAIHLCGPKRQGPFIEVDLPSLSSAALGSLFGNGNGSANSDKLDEAEGGTLYLHDIAQADLPLQRNFLMMLRDGKDGNGTTHRNVNVICSTRNDLRDLVRQGLFTGDLYSILSSVHIKVPPLRERREDILPLAERLLDEAAVQYSAGKKELADDAREFLLHYHWPEDFTELEDMMRKAVVLSRRSLIGKQELLFSNFNAY
jgi:DNA-binding NtrC family response regulator